MQPFAHCTFSHVIQTDAHTHIFKRHVIAFYAKLNTKYAHIFRHFKSQNRKYMVIFSREEHGIWFCVHIFLIFHFEIDSSIFHHFHDTYVCSLPWSLTYFSCANLNQDVKHCVFVCVWISYLCMPSGDFLKCKQIIC